MLTERVSLVGFHTVTCVALLIGLLRSANSAQPVLLGRSPTLSSSRYRVTLEAPQTIFQWQDAAVVVYVQNAQGAPVDDILVTFQVNPLWARYASVRPARARTRVGRVRAILRSNLLGRVRLTVWVGTLMKQATITVVMPIAMGDGRRYVPLTTGGNGPTSGPSLIGDGQK